MSTLDAVLAKAKQNKNVRYPFYAGILDGTLKIACSLQNGKDPKNLKSNVGKAKDAAYGHVLCTPEGEIVFACQKLTSTFKPKDVKALSSALKAAPTITEGREVVAGDGAFKDANDEAPEAEKPEGKGATPPTEGPGFGDNETPKVIWSKSLAAALKSKGASDTVVGRVEAAQKPYEVAFPVWMIEAIEDANKMAFFQQIVDNLNSRLDADAAKIAKILGSDWAPDQKTAGCNKVRDALNTYIDGIVDKSWKRFVASFDVPGKKAQRFSKAKAITLPTIGFGLAVTGAATSGGNPAVAIPAALAAVRSASAGIKAYQVYLGSLRKASTRLIKAAKTLETTLGTAKGSISVAEGVEAGTKAITNALLGAGWVTTISSFRDDAGTVNERLTQSEKVRDKALGPVIKSLEALNTAMTEMEGAIKAAKAQGNDTGKLAEALKATEAEAKALSDSLDEIIDGHAKISGYRTKVDGALDIVEAMEKKMKKGLDRLDVAEKGAQMIVSYTLGAYNGIAGLATMGDSVGAQTLTALGGASDALGVGLEFYAVVKA